jgi:transcriptional regulator with XRE-family HTH domain
MSSISLIYFALVSFIDLLYNSNEVIHVDFKNNDDNTKKPFSKMKTGEKLEKIRKTRNKEYPGEYTWSKVADRCKFITYNGLRKLERSDSEPRRSTVKALAEFYNVPLDIIYSDNDDNVVTFGINADFTADNGESANKESKPELDEKGNIQMNDICVELTMRIYQSNTGAMLSDEIIHEKTPISKDDIKTLEELIRLQTAVVSNYYKKLKELQK